MLIVGRGNAILKNFDTIVQSLSECTHFTRVSPPPPSLLQCYSPPHTETNDEGAADAYGVDYGVSPRVQTPQIKSKKGNMATATTTTIKILLDSIEGGKKHYRQIGTYFDDDAGKRKPCTAGLKADGTPTNPWGHNDKLDADMIAKFPGQWAKATYPKKADDDDDDDAGGGGGGLPKTSSPSKQWNKAKAEDRRYAVHAWTHPTLCVIDWDDGKDINDPRIPELWKSSLPYTFSSGAKDHTGKGLHFYCYCEGMPEGAPAQQVKCLTIGDCDV
eukprot:SAG22_NODE_3895_length_1479_cov_7.587681_1_plen_272_part_10